MATKTKFDVKTEATRAFYAGVGVNDLAVEKVRVVIADVQKRVTGYQKDVQTLVTDVQKDVETVVTDVRNDITHPKALRERAESVVETLTKDAKARRDAVEARVSDLQAEAKGYPAKFQEFLDEGVDTAGEFYGDLVKRGESLVLRIRRQESTKATMAAAKTTVTKAKTTRTQATKTAKAETAAVKTAAKKAVKTAQPAAVKREAAAARSSAKATVTAAKKTASSAAKAVADAVEKVGD